METFRVLAGSDWSLSFALRDAAGEPITTYTAAAQLAASAWTGDDQADVFPLSATWVEPSEGTVRLALAPSATAGVPSALYRVRLTITASGRSVAQPVFLLDLQAAPRDDARRPKTYGSFDQLRALAPYVAEIITADPSLQSDLGEQRAQARRWLDRQILSRARRDLQAEGTADVEASLGRIRGWLDADRLQDPDGAAALACSHRALYLLLAGQLGEKGEPSSYQRQAGHHAGRSQAILRGWAAVIDTSDDGDGSETRTLEP